MLFLACAHALTPEALVAKVEEVAPLRAKRLGTEAPAIPASAWEEVASGEVATGLVDVEGARARKVWGVGIVDVPIDGFFSAINDDRNKPDYTKLSHVIVLKGEPCGTDRTVFQFMPLPLVSDRWWIIRQRINTALQEESGGKVREMAWIPAGDQTSALTPEASSLSVQGMQVTHTYGGWFLIDLGEGKTLVEFWSWSDPGGNIPVRMASSFAAGGIEDTLGTMSDLAKKGPSCRL